MGLKCRMIPMLEQKIKLKQEFKIVPQTVCPFCGNVVDLVRKNFVNSDTDCRLICDKCQNKFQGLLQIFDEEGISAGTYHFLCPDQTIHAMKQILESGRKRLGEKFLRTKHPEIYFSAIKNFGSCRDARKSIK